MADIPLALEIWSIIRDSSRVAAVLVGAGAGGAALIRWGFDRWNYSQENFRRRIVFEGVSFREQHGPDGPVTVRFKSWGDERELSEVIGIRTLERRIAKATRKTFDGILRLQRPFDQRRMMEIFEDALTGNEPQGNMAEVMGRPAHDDVVIFMPTFYREADDGSMIRVYIMSSAMAEKLLDANFRLRLKAHRPRHQPRIHYLCRMAELWAKGKLDGISGGESCVWDTEIVSVNAVPA